MEHELRMYVHGREDRCLHSVMGQCEGKRLCVTLSCRWDDSMNLQEMGWEVVGGGLESSGQGCRQGVGSIEQSDKTLGSIEGGEFLY